MEDVAEAARAICAQHGDDPALLIEILHAVQHRMGFVPEAALPAIATALNIGKAEAHGVMSFYHDFRKSPAGHVVVKLCRAEACQSMGANQLIAQIVARRATALGETDAHGVTVEEVFCLGNCALAPAAMVGERLIGRANPDRIAAAVAKAAA
jgi:formate dehydrogenase subunit gamma